MPKLIYIVFTVLMLILLFVAKSNAADLTVKIFGLRNDKGDVHIALYDNPKVFPSSDYMLREVRKGIINRKTEYQFTNLTPGYYALAAYHDENDNDSFDTNFLGLPTEGYAFSSDAQAIFGPPSFLDAQITLKLEGSTTHIKMG